MFGSLDVILPLPLYGHTLRKDRTGCLVFNTQMKQPFSQLSILYFMDFLNTSVKCLFNVHKVRLIQTCLILLKH